MVVSEPVDQYPNPPQVREIHGHGDNDDARNGGKEPEVEGAAHEPHDIVSQRRNATESHRHPQDNGKYCEDFTDGSFGDGYDKV
ncbi:hypothetical protein ON010_g1194 [Phytophthora cinnamomi]|nr:hypothetical protein ON010_g1194 [Phytophthora cinnamomi]